MAIWQRPTRTPVILHSDRGCQFTAVEYQQFLAVHQVTCSMRRRNRAILFFQAILVYGCLRGGEEGARLSRAGKFRMSPFLSFAPAFHFPDR